MKRLALILICLLPLWQSAQAASPTVDSMEVYAATTSSASHEGNFPATVTAGQLLLIMVAANPTDNTITLSEAGYTTLLNSASNNHASAYFYKEAVGDEDGGTFTIDLSPTSDEVVAYALAISGWDTGTAPELAGPVGAETSTPNPPSLTPTFGKLDALWIAAFTGDASPTHRPRHG